VADTVKKTTTTGKGKVSIPYPAGMALWQNKASAATGSLSRVSIPYPAGMALWPVHRHWSCRRRCPWVSIPYPAGMALWLPPLGNSIRCYKPVSIPYPAGMALWPVAGVRVRCHGMGLNPLSSGDGFVASRLSLHFVLSFGSVSIPYPAGMALWPWLAALVKAGWKWSQSPIQRGWLCGGWLPPYGW